MLARFGRLVKRLRTAVFPTAAGNRDVISLDGTVDYPLKPPLYGLFRRSHNVN